MLKMLITRSGPKIPAVGPFGGGRFFRFDHFCSLMASEASPSHRRGTCGAPTCPGHLGEACKLHYLFSHDPYAIPTNFHISRAS